MDYEKQNEDQSVKLADEMSKAIIDLLPGDQNVVIKRIIDIVTKHRVCVIDAKAKDIAILKELMNDLICTPK